MRLIFLSSVAEVIGVSPHVLRVMRRGSGGQWTLHRLPGRQSETMVDVADVVAWGQRVIRPWTPELVSELVARSLPVPAGGSTSG